MNILKKEIIKMERCTCCGFKTENLQQYNNRLELLCELCAGTKTSSHNNNDYGLGNTLILMKTICYLTNAIIKSNNNIEQELFEIKEELTNIKNYY